MSDLVTGSAWVGVALVVFVASVLAVLVVRRGVRFVVDGVRGTITCLSFFGGGRRS